MSIWSALVKSRVAPNDPIETVRVEYSPKQAPGLLSHYTLYDSGEDGIKPT